MHSGVFNKLTESGWGWVNARYQGELGFGKGVYVLFCTFLAFVLLSNTNPFSLALLPFTVLQGITCVCQRSSDSAA